MLEIKGKKYSKEPFEGYTHRAKVNMEISEFENHKVVKTELSVDIYTDNDDDGFVYDVLWERTGNSVTDLEIIYWASRKYAIRF